MNRARKIELIRQRRGLADNRVILYGDEVKYMVESRRGKVCNILFAIRDRAEKNNIFLQEDVDNIKQAACMLWDLSTAVKLVVKKDESEDIESSTFMIPLEMKKFMEDQYAVGEVTK